MPIQIDRTAYQGRPMPDGRLEKENRSYDILEQLDIPFTRLNHDPTATIEDYHAVDQLLQIKICVRCIDVHQHLLQ